MKRQRQHGPEMREDGTIGENMDKQLKELGRLVEQEAIPERLRDLALRLREALLSARPAMRRPPDH